MATYKIVRHYQQKHYRTVSGMRRLTLEEAQAHCRNPQNSSSTCTDAKGRRRTRQFGPWFDSYTPESK